MDVQLDGMKSPEEAAEKAADFSYATSERVHSQWLEFHGELFVTFVDGYRTVPNPKNTLGGIDKVIPHWDNAWKRRIVEETGSHYKVPEKASVQSHGHSTVCKIKLLSIGEKREPLLEDA